MGAGEALDAAFLGQITAIRAHVERSASRHDRFQRLPPLVNGDEG